MQHYPTMGDGGDGASPQSWFASIKTFIDDNVDEQRIERLRACRVLENILADCQRSKGSRGNKPKSDDSEQTTHRMHLEDVPPGIRMVRYFQWRNVHDYDKKCSREAHSVWACRAGALQCGSELVQLRNCFLDQQQTVTATATATTSTPESADGGDYGTVLRCAATAYEPKARHANKDIPCRQFQEQVGQCVSKNAKLLAQREADRAKRDKQVAETTEAKPLPTSSS